MKSIRIVAWVLVAMAVVFLGRPLISQVFHEEEEVKAFTVGGPFTMTDHNGRAVTEKDFSGKAMAMFAGFTYCPDVCPTTLVRLSGLMDKLGPYADKLQVVLVSVDPERDSADVLKTYLSAFDSRFVGLTGTPAQLTALAKSFRIFYEKVPVSNGGYTMNHSAGVFLFKKSGEFQGTIDLEESDNVALEKLRMVVDR